MKKTAKKASPRYKPRYGNTGLGWVKPAKKHYAQDVDTGLFHLLVFGASPTEINISEDWIYDSIPNKNKAVFAGKFRRANGVAKIVGKVWVLQYGNYGQGGAK